MIGDRVEPQEKAVPLELGERAGLPRVVEWTAGRAGESVRDRLASSFVLYLVLYALFVALYVGLRFAWNWFPNDAINLTLLSRNVFVEAELTPQSGAYPYGYGYPALNTFLSHMTGLPVFELQRYVQPFLISLLAPVAYAALRALTGRTGLAAAAAFLLFLQPDFLFEAVRGSHAKLTWILALSLLLVLSRSLRSERVPGERARWALLFYPLAYGLISSSSFFASNFVFGIAFAGLGGLVLSRLPRTRARVEPSVERLLLVVASSSILFYLFFFHIYPPALRQFRTLQTVGDRVATFLLDVESGANPYAYIETAWVSPFVFPLLTLMSWIVLALSLVAWALEAREFLVEKGVERRKVTLLWLLYTAFSLLMAVSLLLDLAGVLSANLQVRVFPNFMIFAIPMALQLPARYLNRVRTWSPEARAAGVLALAFCVLFFSAASLLKTTNEPLLNNVWQFQTTQEQQAMAWAGTKLRSRTIWTGFDGRLYRLVPFYESWRENDLQPDPYDNPVDSRDFILSVPMEILSARTGFPLPDVVGDLKVYDNGGATLYHARPATPYQP